MKIDKATGHVSLSYEDPGFYTNPHDYFDVLREQAPMFYWEEYNLWCFVAHEDVNNILRDRRFGRQILHLTTREELGWQPIRPDLQPFYDTEAFSILELEPPNHTRIRRLVQKTFLVRQIKRLRPRVEQLVNDLIDQMEGKKQVDLLTDFVLPMPVTLISELLSIPTTMNPLLIDWSNKMLKMYELTRTAEDEHLAIEATNEFVTYLHQFIAYRRKNPEDDLISYLVTIEDEGEMLTEDELICTCIALLNAGHETTANVLANSLYQLLTHRDQLARWQKDASLGGSAVEELLRFEAPLHLFKRWALEDVTYNGHVFPFGSQVAVILGAANRDPAIFDQPHALDIGRKQNPHIAFGHGIHYCVGAGLARMEFQTAIPILLERLPNMTITTPKQYANDNYFHGLESLWVNLNE